MSKKVDFHLKLRGLNEIMKGPEIQAVLQQKGDQIAAAAEQMSNGGEFEATTKTGKWIATTTVRTKDHKALKSVYEDNTLLKALNAGND